MRLAGDLGRDGALSAAAVVLATGGLSLPGTGSDGTGLEIARRLGHTVHATYPALTPLVADPPPHGHLAGVSLEVAIEAPGPGGLATRGGFLFTHRGWSGPAVLDVSHAAVRSRLAGGPRRPLLVRWTGLDAAAWDRLLREGAGVAITPLRRHLPDRLAETLLAEAGVDPGRSLAQLRREERRRLVELLARYPLPWTGDEGYRKAEVTGGGVALAEVAPRTLESRRHAGLFLCGEMLDAFGPIGGHNFQWAWATGRAAGLGAAGAPHPRPLSRQPSPHTGRGSRAQRFPPLPVGGGRWERGARGVRSIRPQSHHRVDPGGAAAREPGGGERHQAEARRHRDEGRRVGRADAEEERRHDPGERAARRRARRRGRPRPAGRSHAPPYRAPRQAAPRAPCAAPSRACAAPPSRR